MWKKIVKFVKYFTTAMEKIRLFDKTFKLFIPNAEIEKAIDEVAAKINKDNEGCTDIPVILCVLNGSMMFTSALMKRLNFTCELVSIKLSSYAGTTTTGKVQELMGFTSDVTGRRVIVVEDIVDTGNTIVTLAEKLKEHKASEVKICTLLFKPEAYTKDVKLDYVGLSIPNAFIVGYGLDYNEVGRNFEDIYVLDKEDHRLKFYVIFGPPGAGKGTHATAMAERYNLHHISTGELLRKEIAAGTELGRQAKALIEDGRLVPDDVVIRMIGQEFKTVKGVNGFLLDGFPRTIEQARVLDDMLAKIGAELTAVVSIMIPDEVVFDRIRYRATIEGRADDASVEIIQHRIDTYHAQTEPEIAFYQEKGKYHEVSGIGTIEEVRERIFRLVDTF
jgi:adenylate kinase